MSRVKHRFEWGRLDPYGLISSSADIEVGYLALSSSLIRPVQCLGQRAIGSIAAVAYQIVAKRSRSKY